MEKASRFFELLDPPVPGVGDPNMVVSVYRDRVRVTELAFAFSFGAELRHLRPAPIELEDLIEGRVRHPHGAFGTGRDRAGFLEAFRAH